MRKGFSIRFAAGTALAHFTAAITTAIAFGLAASPTTAIAQDYPSKPITVYVHLAAGTVSDLIYRAVVPHMSRNLGRQIVVENRPGANGMIAWEHVSKRQSADGYSIATANNSNLSLPVFVKDLPIDPVKELVPVAIIGDGALVLHSPVNAPWNTMAEMVNYAKSNPGKLNYASTGTGGITHLATELFNLLTATKMTHIPYKGTGPAIADLLGGQVQLIFGAMPATIPQVKAGKLRGIGVTTAKRSPALPDTPAIGEIVKDYEAALWYGLWGPKGLPKPIIARWNQEVAKALQTEEMKKRLAADGVEPAGGPPEQFLNAIARDVEKWKKVVKAANIKVSS